MKIILAALLTLTLATQAVAGETIMVCKARGYDVRYYKLIDPVFWGSSVEEKIDLKWVNWCGPSPPLVSKHYKPCEVEIYDSAAKLIEYDSFVPTSGSSVWSAALVDGHNIFIGDRVTKIATTVSDFEFSKLTVSMQYYLDKTGLEIKPLREDRGYLCELQK